MSTAGNEAANNVIDILTRDHNLVKERLAQFATLDPLSPLRTRIALIDDICSRLVVHATVEEELFYPVVRDVINDDKLMDHARAEHDAASQLIKQLIPLNEHGAQVEAKLTELRELVTRHIDEEESEMFPKIRQSRLDLLALGRRLMDRKSALQEQLLTREQLMAFLANRR